MRIAIDLRSLSSGTVSGVENYCLNITEKLLELDKQNKYLLFYNAFKKQSLPDFQHVNSQIKRARLPNKLLNISLKLKATNLENLFGGFDWLFMPNLNQFHVSPKTKVAITVHDLSPVVTPQFYNLKRRLWHKFLNYKQSFNRADVLLAVSEYTKNDLIRIFDISPDKIKVVHPALDHSHFRPNISEQSLRETRNVYGLPGEFVLFLGTIGPRKNLMGAIEAFEKLNSSCYLVIAGRPGWKYSQDLKLINNSPKSAKIKYIGYIEEHHKPALLKLAKMLIYPSFYEGFGFQPLEAMATGTPVIASQLTSLPEVIGQAGLLVNPYDSNSLTTAMAEILNNDDLKNVLINKGLEKAQEFSWERSAKEVLQCFK